MYHRRRANHANEQVGIRIRSLLLRRVNPLSRVGSMETNLLLIHALIFAQ